MEVVSVYNDKGGVGKTTMSLEIAAAMALSGKRVLLVDNDPQGSLSMSCVTDIKSVKDGMDRVYKGEVALTDVICDTYIENLFIVPSGLKLKDYYIRKDVATRDRVGEIIDFMKTDADFVNLFDIVVFDNPPAQDGIALFCTMQADKIVLPVIPDDMCFDALVRTYAFIKEQAPNFLDKLIVIVPSLVKNRGVHKRYLKAIKSEYDGKNDNTIVSETRVGDRAEIPESIGLKQILFISHAASEAAHQFKNLCLDIFPWIEKDSFMQVLTNAAEEKKRGIREKFKKMVEERRKLATLNINDKTAEVVNG
jgi:cellulose biosynthesis protein BcsQ